MLGLCLTAEAAGINEGFDNFQYGVRPRGWTFTGCNKNTDAGTIPGDYDVIPSIILDTDYDAITTITFSAPGNLTFWVRSLAENPSSTLAVKEYIDTSWSRLTLISGISTTAGTIGPLALNGSSSQMAFEYKRNSDASLAIDTISITGAITPVPTAIPAAQPTPVYLVKDWDDYDGDGSTNVAVYNSSNGEWDIEGVTQGVVWGGSDGDIPSPGDYDGDDVADFAYFNRWSSMWYVMATDGTIIDSGSWWGGYGDVPVPGDYDGNGTTDYATWRPSDGIWRIKNVTQVWWGELAGIYPVPGDYDGDQTTDLAFVNPANGTWYIKDIGNYGLNWDTDVTTPMDYDGDGATDMAVWRAVAGKYIIRPIGGGFVAVPAGWPTDDPVVGDFDGDGIADPGVRRNRTGLDARWWWKQSSTGTYNYTDWGAYTDIVVDGATSY